MTAGGDNGDPRNGQSWYICVRLSGHQKTHTLDSGEGGMTNAVGEPS